MAQNNKTSKNKQTKQQQQSKKNVQEKISQQKQQMAAAAAKEQKKCNSCKWIMGSFLLVVLLGAALIYDTEYNGRGVFAKSATGKVLANMGALPYVEKSWYVTMSASARGYKWAEMHVPAYAKPIIKLSCDLYKLVRNAAINIYELQLNYVKSKLPAISNFVDQYVPGLSMKIKDSSLVVGSYIFRVVTVTKEFFSTQVFVGRLSPENLKQAFNNTQNAALQYYNLFHKKVDAYAKLK